MSQPVNNFTNAASTVSTNADVDNVLMQDSPSSKNSGFEDHQDVPDHGTDDDGHNSYKDTSGDEEEIAFKEEFMIPPSFNHPINEETLQDDDHPYVFWASLHLPIPPNPANPMAAVYNALEEFITTLAEEDPEFVVFPYKLSAYESIEDLPPPIETAEDLPDDIDDWLEYFPGAKPQKTGRETYTTLLVRMSKPLLKVVKNLSTWLRNK